MEGQVLLRPPFRRPTYQFGQKDRPEASEMLVIDPAEEHSKTQVDLCAVRVDEPPFAARLHSPRPKTHLGVDQIADWGSEQVDEFLLDGGQLREERVRGGTEEGVGEAAQGQGAREHFELAIGKDVGR